MDILTNKPSSKAATCMINNKLVYLIILGIAFLIVDVLLMMNDPVLIIVKYNLRIDKGSNLHEGLKKEFVGIHLSAYLFNNTNAEQFLTGEDLKLKVEEIGPFTYQETRKNEQLELDMESKVIRYTPIIKTKFLPQESVGNPEDINVTMPNLVMLSMASKVSSMGFLPRLGYNLLTSQLKSKSIVRMTAEDYLWGYEEPLIKLGNKIMPGFVEFDILGILDRLYDKKAIFRYEVSAESIDKFSIRKVNGSGGLDKWGYNDPKRRTICNSFKNAYEGIFYPAEMTGERSIRIYRNILCRILELDYNGKIMTPYGFEGLEYRISNKTYRRNEETECLCNNGNCVEGVSDLSPCFLGLPIVLSNAHFIYEDPMLYDKIEGLKPDEKRHGSSIVIDPKTGMVLDTQFSVQVNLLMRNVGFKPEISSFSDMIIPIAYFKVAQPPLVPEQVHSLHLIYFIGPKILLAVQILLAALALVLLGYASCCIRAGNSPTTNGLYHSLRLKREWNY